MYYGTFPVIMKHQHMLTRDFDRDVKAKCQVHSLGPFVLKWTLLIKNLKLLSKPSLHQL